MPAKFHASLTVASLERSVAFYRNFFGCEPAKERSDYAKFELEAPPLVLSLIPGHPNPGGNLNHIGIRVADREALLGMQMRLETAGIKTNREEGVQCCHSTQTKFWVTDPDCILWELYILHEDEDQGDDHGVPQQRAVEIQEAKPARVIWQHQIPNPVPARILHDDNSVHEVVLEGTANMEPVSVSLSRVLVEAYRILRPGGEIVVHGLAGDKPFKQLSPNLPGPAAVVQHVPMEAEPMKAMRLAGFIQIRFEKLSPAPYFVVDGVEMREILLIGRKPGHRPQSARHQAVYLGPLAEVADDHGNVFKRGERVPLNIHDWTMLSQSSVANQFLFLAPNKPSENKPDEGGDRKSQGFGDKKNH